MPRTKPARTPTTPTIYRLTLRLPGDLIYHLKARAAAERITVSTLVAQWVRSWVKPESPRAGGAR